MTGPRVLLVLATSGGGVGRHVASLAAGLVAGGRPVTVAGPAQTLERFDLASTGARVEAVELGDRPRPGADLRAWLRLRRVAARCDVVHAHGLRAGALAVAAARSRGRNGPAVVVTVHNALVGGARVAAVHGLLARVVARGADAVLGVSGDLVAQLRDLGARDVDRALVPAPQRGSAGRDRETVRAELDLAEGTALLLTVARLAPQKGLDLLLDALALLQRAPGSPPVVAAVAGDGPLAALLERQARDRGLPLRLLGARRDVPDLLAAADVVVVPSLWEGQPLVVQEALRAGAALVATDVGGVAEVAGDGAVLVPGGAPQALADAVRGLLTDPGARAGLRGRARARAGLLPRDRDALAQVEALYGRLAAARRDGPAGTWPSG